MYSLSLTDNFDYRFPVLAMYLRKNIFKQLWMKYKYFIIYL